MSARLRETKAMNAKNAEILRGLLKKPDNRLCVDCKRNDARWASTNLGIFLCIRCSGIHRGLGVHISRVRSVDLDTWSPEQIANMERWGNAKANIYWEAHLKEGHQPPEHKIEQFIRSKYESKRWAMEGPIPDPDTLGVPASPAAAAPATSSAVEATSPKVKSPAQSKSSAIDLLGGAFGDSGSSSQASSKASASLAYPSPPSSRSSSLPSAVLSNGQSRAQQVSSQAQAQPAPAPVPKQQAVNNGNGLFDLDFNAPAAPSTNNATTARKNANDIMSLFGSSSSVVAPSQNTDTSGGGLDAFASLNLGGTSSWATPGSTNSITNNTSQYQSHASHAQSGNRAASNSISASNPWAAPASDASSTRPSQPNSFYSPPQANNASLPPAYNNGFSNVPSVSNSFASPGNSVATNSNTASIDFFNSQDIWGAPVSGTNNNKTSTDAFGGFSSGNANKTSGGFDDLWS